MTLEQAKAIRKTQAALERAKLALGQATDLNVQQAAGEYANAWLAHQRAVSAVPVVQPTEGGTK